MVEQTIRYPTDRGLLNEARKISKRIIDSLPPLSGMKKKVRTYRRNARRDYLALVKQRRPGGKKRRKAIARQLRYLKCNLGHIEAMLNRSPGSKIPLSPKQLRQYRIIRRLHVQQKQMFETGTRRCDDRIVSIHQPHVRPIVRGKQNKIVEFGAKLGVSLGDDGVACAVLVASFAGQSINKKHQISSMLQAAQLAQEICSANIRISSAGMHQTTPFHISSGEKRRKFAEIYDEVNNIDPSRVISFINLLDEVKALPEGDYVELGVRDGSSAKIIYSFIYGPQ